LEAFPRVRLAFRRTIPLAIRTDRARRHGSEKEPPKETVGLTSPLHSLRIRDAVVTSGKGVL